MNRSSGPALPPILARELESVRGQMHAGRAVWQEQDAASAPNARLPVEAYASEAVREREIERLFRPLPLIVGHASELAAGQVLANDDHGVPLLLARDADGVFRAFWNVCRHRGMRLVAAADAASDRTSVVCPYHGWTYRLDGTLRHRLHAETFDPCPARDTDLVALPAEERHGLLWVVPTPGAPIDVAAWLGPLDAEMPFLGVDALVHFRTVRTEVDANWKLMVDAFLEAYHIRVLHRDTIWPFFADGVTATERVGPHVQSLVARRAAADWAAAGGRIEDVRDRGALCKLVTPTNVIFPNAIHIFHPDYLSVVTLHPLAAGRHRWIHRMLVPKAKTTPDWLPHWEKTFRLIEQGVFQKEDIACAVGIQQGFASGANAHLVAGRAEQGVGWFHDAVRERLGAAG